MILFSLLATIGLVIILIGYSPRFSQCQNDFSEEHVLIKIDELEIRELPQIFESNFLPCHTSSNDPNGREFDTLGSIELMPPSSLSFNYEPAQPFETGTSFYVYDNEIIEEIPFQMTITCVGETDQCDMYPLPLKRLLNLIDINKRTVIIVGGFLNKAPKEWQKEIASRWHKLEEVNTIIVGWNNANQFPYGQAIQNTRIVARQISVFLYYLAKVHGKEFSSDEFMAKIHLIGHSLGAHISGFVGKDFCGQLGRITGLDPAGPSFSDASDRDRIHTSDARFVDAYHSNGLYEYSIYMGILRHVAHIDYYPNGGSQQPGQTIDIFRYSHEIVREHYIGSLDYLIYVQQRLGDKRMRLLSFPSRLSYGDFLKGLNFVQGCPMLAFDLNLKPSPPSPPINKQKASSSSSTSSSSRGSMLDSDLHLCSAPIDLTSGPDELQKELALRFRHDLDAYYDMNYYYFTRDDRPFVMDTQLFKMKLKVKRSSSSQKSKISAQKSSTPGDKQANESDVASSSTPPLSPLDVTNYNVNLRFEMLHGNRLTKTLENYKLHENDGDYHLIAPIESVSHSSKFELVELEGNNFYLEQPIRQWETLSQIFPISIAITLTHEPSNKLVRSFSNRTRDWLFRATGITNKKDTSGCDAMVNSVRLQPLSNLSRLVIGVYSDQRGDLDSSAKIVELQESDDFPEIAIDQESVDCLTDYKPEMKIKLYLHTIIIGPKKNHFGNQQQQQHQEQQ